MKTLLLFLSIALTVFGQITSYPGGTGSGSSSTTAGTAPVLSNVLLSSSASTIAATWNTNFPADSNLLCGTSAGHYTFSAADAHAETNVTSHQAIVAGLSPSTVYFCVAQSIAYGGGTGTSAPSSSTTAALPASTAISSFAVGPWAQVGNSTVDGDTFYNTVCDDGNTYVTLDDSHGFAKTGAANMLLAKFSNEFTLAGSNVNFLPGYGTFASSNGLDSNGHTRSNKLSGLSCIGGKMYALLGRQNNSTSSGYPDSGISGLFNQQSGSIIRSTDFGVTWDSVAQPDITSPLPFAPNPPTYQYKYFGDQLKFASPSFVMYGVDDGTLGYTSPTCDVLVSTVTASCRVDNAAAYTYIISAGGFWNDGSSLYLARVAKARLKNLNPADVQYYTNALADGNGLEDGNWSPSTSNAAVILSSSGQVGYPSMQYIPYLNRYVLLEWYYQNCNNGVSNTGCPSASTPAGQTTFQFYDAAHPWGPFTSVGTISSYASASGSATGSLPTNSGLYNPTLLQRTAITNLNGATSFTLLAGGNFLSQASWYTINYASLNFNVSGMLLDTVCPGANCPNGAWSVARQLRTAYSGNILLIRRASDSTTLAIGNDGSGNVNQSAITTFCTGTTCGIDTIYDQSGTSFNLTTVSTTVANECAVYKTGALVTQGGKLSCQFPANTSQGYLATGYGSILNGLSAEAMFIGNMTSTTATFGSLLASSDGTDSEGSGTQAVTFFEKLNTTSSVASAHNNSSSSVAYTYNTFFWGDSIYNNPVNANKSFVQVAGTAATPALYNSSTTALASTEVAVGYLPSTSGFFMAGFFTEGYVWNSISGLANSFHTNAQSYFGVS